MFVDTDITASSTYADVPNGRSAYEAVRKEIGNIPAWLDDAIEKSGILKEETGNFDWLKSPRVLAALQLAHEAHHGLHRKNGNAPREIHEIWTAHFAYNDIDLQDWLKKHGLPKETAAFVMATHDYIENTREFFFGKNNAADMTDTGRLINNIRHAWNDDATFPTIMEAMTYMTDTLGIHKKVRIDDQFLKTFDTEGKIIVNFLCQRCRMIDKLHHVVADAYEAIAGHLSPEGAKKAFEKADIKSLFLFTQARAHSHFDLIKVKHPIWRLYKKSMGFLAQVAGINMTPEAEDSRIAWIMRPSPARVWQYRKRPVTRLEPQVAA